MHAMGQRPITDCMLSDVIASRAYNGIVSIHIMLLSENSVCGHMCHIAGRLRCQDLRGSIIHLASDVTASGEYSVADRPFMRVTFITLFARSWYLPTITVLRENYITTNWIMVNMPCGYSLRGELNS